MSQPIVSVVIATHNRSGYLARALQSLALQTFPKCSYEVIVVDNASTDGTKEVILGFCKAYSFFRHVCEKRLGSNNARNTGWRSSQGKYVAFIDDDAIADEKWIETIVSTFDRIIPQPGIVGGMVEPLWEGNKPDWLKGKMFRSLSILEYGEKERFLTEKEFFFSVNMAIRRELIEKAGGFNNVVSRSGKNLNTNDEIPIAINIRKMGYGFYYDPSISVKHIIPEERLRTYFAQGYSDALMWEQMEKPGFREKSQRAFMYLYYFGRNPKYIARLLLTPSDYENLYKKLIAHAWLGFIRGLFSKIAPRWTNL